MAGFRKRTRAMLPSWGRTAKRTKRVGRFKRKSRTSRSGTVRTGYAGASSNITYKKKRFNRRRWKRDLYKHTQFKQTFRSLNNGSFNVPVGSITGVNNAVFALANGVIGGGVTPFWTVAGGAIPVDQAGVVPIFSPSSIILKGGMSKLTVTNNGLVDTIRAKVWAVWAKSRPDYTNNVPATLSNVPNDWDPTVHPDFHESFTVLFGREVLLLPGSRPMELSYRYKCRKIDTDEFGIEGGQQLIWMMTFSETGNGDAIGTNVTVINSHNLAFVGDAST